ncbi:MAG: SHOCT domain-containing protein [Candidatus Aminicenantaceae bacterium]
MMWGNHGFMGGFMWILWIAIIIGLVFLIIWIVQQSKQGGERPKEEPLEILEKRYARGEIDKKEFEQKKNDILSS